MSAEFLRRGLLVLAHVAGSDINPDIDDAYRRAELARLQPDPKDFSQWFTDPSSYLVLQDWMPRNQVVETAWSEEASKYLPSGDISTFINDEESDPHLLDDLVKLRRLVKESNYDPDIYVTTTKRRLNHLILFGAADGARAKELIERLNPQFLTVAVTEWEDWVSSFWTVDWGEIWNQYCIDPEKRIYALRTDDAHSLAAYLADSCLPSLEHAATYCAPSSSDQLLKLHQDFNSNLLKRMVLYTGFAMDEYNMIWNSWQSLKNKPRVFHVPTQPIARGLKCIVCGSGPSLDSSLQAIKELSQTHLIIACASNYGTLRRASIDVDILCLLERGDFMVEQYRETVQKYGAGSTRLLASVTTPSELHALFAEPMVYFRPALTPLAIFADSPQEVLSNEGPQSINTGIALAGTIGASSILLCGVDLGVVNHSHVRSEAAIGDSPRDFPLDHPGNLKETVYTNSMLLDGKVVVEKYAAKLADQGTLLFNASDGVLIEGFSPIEMSTYVDLYPVNKDCKAEYQRNVCSVWEWWSRQPLYQPDRFAARWRSSRPRLHTRQLSIELLRVLDQTDQWIPNLCSEMSRLLSCTAVPKAQQFPRRIIRGHLLKCLLAITRQLIVMADVPDKSKEFERGARLILSDRIIAFEHEIYGLLDTLEGLEGA